MPGTAAQSARHVKGIKTRTWPSKSLARIPRRFFFSLSANGSIGKYRVKNMSTRQCSVDTSDDKM